MDSIIMNLFIIYTPLNSLEYQIIYYSLFTLCQLSIELFKSLFLSTTAINLSYQHKNIHSYEDVYLIENINLNLYIHDIFYLYLNNTITINQLEQIINEYNLTSKDLQNSFMLCAFSSNVSCKFPWRFFNKKKGED